MDETLKLAVKALQLCSSAAQKAVDANDRYGVLQALYVAKSVLRSVRTQPAKNPDKTDRDTG